MYCCHHSFLHPPLRFERPEIIAGHILIRRPVGQPLPLPHRDPIVLADLESRGEIDEEGKAGVLGVSAALTVLELAGAFNGTHGELRQVIAVARFVNELDIFSPGVVGEVRGDDEAKEGGIGEDDGLQKVIWEAKVVADEADVLEAEAAGAGSEEEELAEAADGVREHGADGVGLLAEAEGGAGGEADPETALDGVVEHVEDVGVLEEEITRFVGAEGVVAAGDNVELGDGEGTGGLGEEVGLEVEGAAYLLLHLHDVVEAVVADALQILRDRGGL